MITLENFVVQCKMPWGKDGEDLLQYIGQDAYYTTDYYPMEKKDD